MWGAGQGKMERHPLPSQFAQRLQDEPRDEGCQTLKGRSHAANGGSRLSHSFCWGDSKDIVAERCVQSRGRPRVSISGAEGQQRDVLTETQAEQESQCGHGCRTYLGSGVYSLSHQLCKGRSRHKTALENTLLSQRDGNLFRGGKPGRSD